MFRHKLSLGGGACLGGPFPRWLCPFPAGFRCGVATCATHVTSFFFFFFFRQWAAGGAALKGAVVSCLHASGVGGDWFFLSSLHVSSSAVQWSP